MITMQTMKLINHLKDRKKELKKLSTSLKGLKQRASALKADYKAHEILINNEIASAESEYTAIERDIHIIESQITESNREF